MSFNTSESGVFFIKSYEKLELAAYDDGFGNLTIGYGHRKGVYAGQTITEAEAVTYLKQDLQDAESIVKDKVTYAIDQHMFDALVSLVFNTGTSLTNTQLLSKLNKGNVTGAAEELLTFNKVQGVVVPGLTERRKAEKEMFLMDVSPAYSKIPANAKLTIMGSDVGIRVIPDGHKLRLGLPNGTPVQATERTVYNGNPWFHIAEGWVSGNYVQGWIKDYNDNNRWWYVEKGYSYPTSTWMTIGGKDYCFGADAYLFVECYIKSEVENKYYWVDDDGVYLSQFDTDVPDAGYRVVENYKTEKAYKG